MKRRLLFCVLALLLLTLLSLCLFACNGSENTSGGNTDGNAADGGDNGNEDDYPTPTEENYFTYEIVDGKATITGFDKGFAGEVVIPKTLGGAPVIGIGEIAFQYCECLTAVTIPNSVTNIGAAAFYGCTGLITITIPDSITSIGGLAFHNTAYYKNDKNWESGILYIGKHLISANNSISDTVNIKDGTLCIAGSAFYYRSKLTSITIPNSVVTIGKSAFECTGLASVTIPESVTSIGDYAFADCTSLISITIEGSVTSLGSDAFDKTGYYNNDTNWENGLLYIGNHLIAAKKDIVSDTVSVKRGTICIASAALRNCSDLSSITIPDSVTTINSFAFFDCSALTSVHFEGNKAGWSTISKGYLWNEGTGNYTVYCTDENLEKQQ